MKLGQARAWVKKRWRQRGIPFRTIDSWLAHLTPRQTFWMLACANLLLLVAALSLLLLPRAGAFSIDARTEVLAVAVPAGGLLPGGLDKAAILGTDASGCTGFAFYQPAERNVEIEAVWKGKDRWILAHVAGDPNLPIGSYLCAGEEREARGSIMLAPFSGPDGLRTMVLEGDVTLGQLPGTDPDTMLLSGSVKASASSLPFPSSRAVETSELILGDEIRLYPDPDGEEPAAGTTIVRLDDEAGAFHVVSYAVAAIAEVKRLGVDRSLPIVIAPSLWSRFQAQSEWPLLLLAVALLLNLFAGIRHYADSAREHPEPKKKKA